LDPWWLRFGYPLSLLNSPFGRVTRILENQTRLQRLAEEDGEQKWVSDYQYQRLHAVREFLADPGYSTADQIRFVHRLAPDMFGDDMCALYLTTIWPPRHLALLKWDTFLHALGVACPLLAVALTKIGAFRPALTLLALWVIVIGVEFIWSVFAGIMRQMQLLHPDLAAMPGIDADYERRYLVKSLRWWQRPVGKLMFPLINRWCRHRGAASIELG
jgi:hypothetical protein